MSDGDAKRLHLVRAILCLASVAGIAVSPRLWQADRPFPTVPVYPWIPQLPQIPTLFLTVTFAISLLALTIPREVGKWVLVPPALGALLVVFDINRCQPWFLQYMPMLAALALPPKARWAVCTVPIVGVYFWSGLHKVNASFAIQVFPWLLRPFHLESLAPLWPIAPIWETGTALLLLFPRTRRFGIAGALLMHAFLLVALGPFGQNYDSIVWPWNVGVAALVVALFGKNQASLLPAWSSPLGKAFLLFFGLLPALNFFDRWDGFLSASFYSGKLCNGWIYLTARGASALPVEYRTGNEGFVQENENRFRLDILHWSMSRLNAPPYAEPRFYAGVARELVRKGVPLEEMNLFVRDPSPLTKDSNAVSEFRSSD